ncbi:hypothetical protein K4K58_006867 [Colletotrichum sp. SAR11_239]|nr:hypothetical protein K4K58_006867 [Colletotrichum sp. SAR11_239]
MCSTTKTPCVYPVPEGLSRSQAQKQKFTDVSRAHESSRRVLELLSASQDGASHDILQQLKHSKHLDNTIQSIADASLLLPRGDGDDEMGDPPVTTPQPEDNMLADTAQNLTGSTDTSIILPVSRWTTVLKDDRILTQLLEIFWAWEGTLSRLVVRDLFSAELSNADAQQKHQFCSPLLVNAILAVSSLHSTRKHSSLHTDAKKIAQKFADCAFDLLDAEEDVSSLTLLQGAAVLWVYCSNEGTRVSRTRAARLAGLMLRTWSTLGLGTDESNLFHQPETQPTNDLEVWQAVSYIAWGFYCFFAKASLVCSPYMLISKPLIMKIFEAQDGLSAGSLGSASSAGDIHLIDQTWNAYQLQVLTAECSLCEIIDQFVSGFVTNDTQRPILDSGRSLKLLATFTSQSGPDFDGRNAVSLQTLHASSLMSNLWIYRGLYTLKYEYWAAEHCSFAVHTLLPQMAEPAVRDTIAKACCVLHEMGIRSGFSGRAAELLRDIEGTARTRGIRIPPYGKGSKSPDVDAMPKFVVNGARVFDGSGGGLLGDADENGCAVSFDSTIGDVR